MLAGLHLQGPDLKGLLAGCSPEHTQLAVITAPGLSENRPLLVLGGCSMIWQFYLVFLSGSYPYGSYLLLSYI